MKMQKDLETIVAIKHQQTYSGTCSCQTRDLSLSYMHRLRNILTPHRHFLNWSTLEYYVLRELQMKFLGKRQFTLNHLYGRLNDQNLNDCGSEPTFDYSWGTVSPINGHLLCISICDLPSLWLSGKSIGTYKQTCSVYQAKAESIALWHLGVQLQTPALL